MRSSILLILLLSVSFFGTAQSDLVNFETETKQLFEQLQLAQSDSIKLKICDQIEDGFEQILNQKESFDYPFSKLDKMGKLTSPDNLFRIYNWNCVLSNGSYRYYGLLQLVKKGKSEVILLKDNRVDASMFTNQTEENWSGALYYKIIPFKSKGANTYLLLGWDGNNYSTNKKLIEVLSIDKKNNIQFGKALISWRGKMLNRVVFEYAQQASMTIQYIEKEKKLVFDHLAPSLPVYENQFEYYGPDFSYDALVLKKGIWELKENIDIRNK